MGYGFEKWARDNIWLFWVCLVINIVMLILIFCMKAARFIFPWNYVLLTVFTASEAYMVAVVCSYYDPSTVFIAACMTAVVTIALTLYAMFTKRDFSQWIGMAVGLGSVLLLLLIFGLFFHNRWFEIIICAVGVLVYSIYLIIDTQLIMGKGTYSLQSDEYVIAAILIYIDIIQLFLYILRCIGTR